MEQAGADAIELNIYAIITDPNIIGADVEQNYCDLVRQVKANVSIPVAVKFSHFFSASQIWANSWTRPAPTDWCSSIAFTSRISILNRSKWCPA